MTQQSSGHLRKRFDGAIKGFGGCPMANDELVGNLATEMIVSFLEGRESLQLDKRAFRNALQMADKIFLTH